MVRKYSKPKPFHRGPLPKVSTPGQLKSCFVVCPIGEEGTSVRERSDDLFENLIKPVCESAGYLATRTIDDSRPGSITADMIKYLNESDLVIIDLTTLNANVLYETAIRHQAGEPFIHMSEDTSQIPFDVFDLNVIQIRQTGFGGREKTISELSEQISKIDSRQANFDTPVSQYHTRRDAEKSGNLGEIEIEKLKDEVAHQRRLITDLLKSQDENRHRNKTFGSSFEDYKIVDERKGATKPKSSFEIQPQKTLSDKEQIDRMWDQMLSNSRGVKSGKANSGDEDS